MEAEDCTQTSLRCGPNDANHPMVSELSLESAELREESDQYVPYKDYIPGRDV